jgi:predicted nucleic acid-binding protein
MIVLDTNVISELLRPAPAAQVEAWLAAQDGATVCFTAVGEAELRYGVAMLPAGRPISQFDCQIAAIARAHEAAVATRNTTDYEGCGLTVIDPWQESAGGR